MKTIGMNSLQVFQNIVLCFWGKHGSSKTKLFGTDIMKLNLMMEVNTLLVVEKIQYLQNNLNLSKISFAPEMGNRIFCVILRSFWVVYEKK